MTTPPSTPRPLSRLQRVKAGAFDALPAQGEKRIVSLDRLLEDPANERRTFRNMEGLIATVRAVGIIEPLIVEPAEGGRYLIVIGHRRHRAARAAGLEKVPVLIGDAGRAAQRRRKSLISNVQREEVGPVELAEGLQALMDEDPEIRTQRELARIIGKREAWVSDMLRILTLPPRLQAKLRSTEVSIPYDATVRIARLKDEGQQGRLIDALLSGATYGDIRKALASGKVLSAAAPKPKEVFRTGHGATVIVQSLTAQLTRPQVRAALREALRRARG